MTNDRSQTASKKHTGRPVHFDRLDRSVLYTLMGAFLLRLAAPQLLPDAYLHWIHASALLWSLGFALLAWRYLPYLARPRIDGREH